MYVGISAGAIRDPRLRRRDLRDSDPPAGSGKALGLVYFPGFPHLYSKDTRLPLWSTHELWAAETTSSGVRHRRYFALKVVDGTVDVVSEGHWKLFTP